MASVPGPSLGPHHQHIVNRKYQPCPTLLSKYTPDQLVTYCPHCDRFVAVCCECDVRPGKQKRVCHRFRVVYTDGACPNNGEPTATAGVGVAFGPTVDPDRRLSVPVDDDIDSHPTRSSQRAELLAAILALGFIENTAKRSRTGDECLLSPHHASETAQWIVATDSDYLFQGITDWVPNKWMPNGMRTAQGREPANRDLFLGLEISLSVLEEKYNTRVGFWHIPRKMNTIADGLAKAAAEHGTIASRFRMPDRDVETVLVL
ncbi:ribonuclease H-like domain-containing protein [Rhodofomes roseus]|uniref:ribonuclease H n=1 Tax=Rhodofomes roseus TaxID=34475 RepID=A0ABQ8JZI1_9APHY|nr:ribonuclease H-like domain-containing protein [Rhodofomes roseus]KAH9829459.1 ribonuclease H-like domain-containing protein [Rhodofomes roseus]